MATIFRIGDRVTITIPRENRDWGYNPCPDGTEATVVGFSEICRGRGQGYADPGVYQNDAWIKLRFDTGHHHTELDDRLHLLDSAEENRRWQELRASGDIAKWIRLRDLPETRFWEGDQVCWPGEKWIQLGNAGRITSESDTYTVVGIDYNYIGQSRLDGSPMSIYRISSRWNGGWHTSAGDADLVLVERGNIWRYYRNEPLLPFADLREEAEFFKSLGQYEEVRNPANNRYKWSKEELLRAIYDGTIDGFAVGHVPFSESLHHSAIRFHDRDLGRLVAAATLEGFEEETTTTGKREC